MNWEWIAWCTGVGVTILAAVLTTIALVMLVRDLRR